jgi:hypothetical protein
MVVADIAPVAASTVVVVASTVEADMVVDTGKL